ncbi:MAG: hypothetical protein Q8O13_04575 [Candidatus Omnitrophota bacterium]|nr:hypothetical protein [Candidatus Omnitrophota bacterium]
MAKRLLRSWIEIDVDEVSEHLLIIGDLLASCSKCSSLDLKSDSKSCPKCNTQFKYIAFRNPEENFSKILKLKQENPNSIFIDYNDFKKITGSIKARKLFKS